MKISRFFSIVAAVSFLAVFVSAQHSSVVVVPVFTTLKPPTMLKVPIPKFPEVAKKAGYSGKIRVAVTVGLSGNVSSVGAADGPYPFCPSVTAPGIVAIREAARKSAEKAVFASVDAAVDGFIEYDFRPYGAGKIVEMRLDRVPPPTGDSTNAEATSDSQTKIVDVDVIKPQAIKLGKPIYPASAKAVHAGGTVLSQVIIETDGSVYSAQAVSGHPLLRRSAEIAACDSRFTPTLFKGEPVKVSGVITYNFVP